ncbi:MAG: glycine betaine/L-proline ABC transporter ATP-binding protein [Desulfitobacteriaceae bacterium]|nr:glycine betaine/L-proline ABC transporter ATP-binding protein [Desulfitobacteriaceae bacterium]MDD4345894.1 glycine betaine/L-proline ABC transporter ATP-binding protein [Desulfitobacteriaceae bacterium]MDD4401775.1 glycine betaine/L-proline ABC transporter ATP-binding protein [Desulfitobacteriaceae bacterium]
MAKFEIKNLYKIYGKNPEPALKLLKEGVEKEKILAKTKQVIGLDDINLTIDEGEIFVVMGLSGSGKSTLIRCLNRLIDPTSGSILIDKEDITKMSHDQLLQLRRQKLGMVFQRFALFPHLTILENTEYGLKIQGVAKKEREKKAREALETVGLQGWEKSLPQQLSGGMQQRVGLARALANDPDILLMDEPFSALDPLIRRDMQDELMALQQKLKKTIVFITHDLDEALKVGDRIALMKDGKVVQIGTPEEILTTPATTYVRKFVEDVDKTKILTAEQVMKKPEPVVFIKDGPRVALHKIKEYGISSIFVTDRDFKLLGLLMAEKAAEAVKKGEKDLNNYIEKEIIKVMPDTPVRDMFNLMAETSGPVAVVSPENKFVGVIVKGAVFAGLAGGEKTD